MLKQLPFPVRLLAISLPLVSNVYAQSSNAVLEEVIVTAQKRDQAIQDVPATVNAIGAQALDDFNILDFESLEQLAPGLDTRSVDGRAGSIALRGVEYNPNSAAAQAVDVYWNDTTLGSNSSGAIFQQIFDLDSIEIVRGAQGTLQGRSSPAGALKLNTAKAKFDEFSGYVRSSFAENAASNTQAAVNVPLIEDKLAVRLAAVYDDNELQETRNLLDGNVSDSQTRAARLSLAWQATESLAVDFSYQYQENNLDRVTRLQGQSTLPQQPQALPAIESKRNLGIQVDSDVYQGRFEVASLQLSWDLGEHQLDWVAGYSELRSAEVFDNGQGNANSNVIAGFASPTVFVDSNFSSSQELRLSSQSDADWQYMIGVYYGQENGQFDRHQYLGPKGPNQGKILSPFTAEDIGVFTHHSFQLNDNWRTEAGLRWQRAERFNASDIFLANGRLLRPLLGADVRDRSEEAVTGSWSISYQADEPDAVTYFSVAKSFRPGGVTITAVNLGDLGTYQSEDSISYELGSKLKLLDGRLNVNAAVFYQDFDSYITRLSRISVNDRGLATRPRASGITTNGDAEVTGIELEVQALLSDNWQVNGGLSFTEAEFKDGETLPCNNGMAIANGQFANVCEVSGLELGIQPKLSANLALFNQQEVGNFELYQQWLVRFVGARTEVDAPSGQLGSYVTADWHIGLRDEEGGWDLSLFAKNLFDRQTINNIQPQFRIRAGLPTGYQRVDAIAGRTMGVSFKYQF